MHGDSRNGARAKELRQEELPEILKGVPSESNLQYLLLESREFS